MVQPSARTRLQLTFSRSSSLTATSSLYGRHRARHTCAARHPDMALSRGATLWHCSTLTFILLFRKVHSRRERVCPAQRFSQETVISP